MSADFHFFPQAFYLVQKADRKAARLIFGWRRPPSPQGNIVIEHAGYVDIHCHILPGLDDGAGNLDAALALAGEAAENGVGDIIATPHLNDDLFPNVSEQAERAFARLRAALSVAGIPINLHLGYEVRADPSVMIKIDANAAPCLAGSPYLLLEFPFDRIPPFARELIFRMQVAGARIIIAHPERNLQIQKDHNELEPYIAAGVLTQINTTSLTGLFGKKTQRTGIALLKRGWVDIMASDAHGAGLRGPNFKEAVNLAARHVGGERAQTLVRENPRRILESGLTKNLPSG